MSLYDPTAAAAATAVPAPASITPPIEAAPAPVAPAAAEPTAPAAAPAEIAPAEAPTIEPGNLVLHDGRYGVVLVEHSTEAGTVYDVALFSDVRVALRPEALERP
ncbi:MAG: hypothetical protein JWM85_1126 [Acidimicrobiaceae bacterium]|nr:hypothetical protein [Acidimicrobiaceae bacterium]